MSNHKDVKLPTFKDLLNDRILMLGLGFGSGLIPKAPGTWGTLVGGLLFIPFLLYSMQGAWLLFAFSILFGCYICGYSANWMQAHDHGSIVWDEFAGIWLVMLLLPAQTPLYWLLAFIFFRIFDIFKPWPISWFDKNISGGLGIMLDDIIAALAALVLIWAVNYSFFS